MSRTLAAYLIFLISLSSGCQMRFDFEITQRPAKTSNEVTLSSESELVSASTATVQLAFSEDVELSEIEMDAFRIEGGELGSLIQADPKTFSFVATVSSPTLTISLPEQSFKSEEGNWNIASNTLTITRDELAPSVSLSATTPSNASPIPVTIVFSEDVEGLEASDFTLTNASAVSLSQNSASNYTFTIAPTSDGLVSIALPASAAQDVAGNDNTASPTLSLTSDRTAPTVALSTTESSPSFAADFSATATFSEQVTGFVLGDLSATNATLSNFSTSDNTIFTFDVTPSSAGTVSIDISTSVATDATGNPNTAATTLSVTHADCPAGYIPVPGNAAVGAPNDFCVMQFEAKAWNDANTNGVVDTGEVDANGCGPGGCFSDPNWGLSTHQPISQADGQPWRRIDMNNAFAECRSLNTESTTGDITSDANSDGTYALISNPEWMTIARNAELVAANWTGSSVGSGCLKQGNVGSSPSCTSPDSGYNAATGPDSGSSRSDGGTAQLQLSNGEIIWDLSGNLWEWVDWDSSSNLATVTPANKAYVAADGSPQFAWREFRDLDTNISGGDEMPPESWQANDINLTGADGIGRYLAGGNSSGGAALRGGDWGDGSNAGAFVLHLSGDPSSVLHSFGFRCVFRAP